MHWLTLTFEEESLERAYNEDLFERYQRRQTPLIYVLIVIATVALLAVDYFVIPDVFSLALVVRMGVILPTELLFFALVPTRFYQRLYFLILLVPMLTGWWCFFRLGAAARPPGSYLYIVWPALFSLPIPLALQFTTRRALIATVLVLALYVVMELWIIHSPPAVRFYMLFVYVNVTELGIVAARIADKYRRTVFLQRRELESEKELSERLLHNILPASIAERLKRQPGVIADGFEGVTVLFADIVGFTVLSERIPPAEVVKLLNELFSAFDEMAQRHGLEKIKTIGDAYMVVGGLPIWRPDHASAVAKMALEMRDSVARLRGGQLKVRIGMHSGPVVAGVIGTAKFSYDLWGDTVNTASRMESHGLPGLIHITESCRRELGDEWEIEPRGNIEVKGKGPMQTFWLKGRRGSSPAVDS